MGYGYGYGMFWDPTYFLVIIGVILCMAASSRVRSTYRKYAAYRSGSGLTGAQVAQKILSGNGMGNVQVRQVAGELTDHFDPRSMTVNLSSSVYGSGSVAAIAVAAHECGHVLQHRDNYFPYNFRHVLVPVANIGSGLSWILIIIGIFMGYYAGYGTSTLLIDIGIWCFALAVLFQIVTLPVEFNASRRALAILTGSGAFSQQELQYSRKVLHAAALTYVAGAAASLLQLLRLILLFGGRRNN